MTNTKKGCREMLYAIAIAVMLALAAVSGLGTSIARADEAEGSNEPYDYGYFSAFVTVRKSDYPSIASTGWDVVSTYNTSEESYDYWVDLSRVLPVGTEMYGDDTMAYLGKVEIYNGSEPIPATLQKTVNVADTNRVKVDPNPDQQICLYLIYEPKPVPLPATPSKAGHTFVGWYFDAELSRPYDGSPIYADTALYAKFEINTYTVTYDLAGGLHEGITSIETKTVNYGTTIVTPEVSRTGYTFTGWYLADGTQYTNQAITANQTLTAHWEKIICTVTFYVGDEKYTDLQVPYGAKLIDVMQTANIESYRAMDMTGVRLSKQSIITESTDVLVKELTGYEKFGDFVGRNPWFIWTTVGVFGVLLIISVVGIASIVHKR